MQLTLVVFMAGLMAAAAICEKPWMDVSDTPSQRAQALLAKMNDTEKFVMLHGQGWGNAYVGQVPANTRLGIPMLALNDGPQGFRNSGYSSADNHPGTSTQWPSGMTIGAMWDAELAGEWGKAMGEEFAGKGSNLQLGPAICIARVPRCGRLFEYESGEDPFLGYKLVQPVVQGIQGQGVIANAKHYVLNSQETNRRGISENIDERTLKEIYLPPFEGAVEAGVGSFMCSYNLINGVHACENNATLNTYLKHDMNFTGFVMSDWDAMVSTVDSANHGVDMEMPDSNYFGSALPSAVAAGEVSMATIDDKVLRILTPMFQMGLFDRPQPTGDLTANVTSEAHNALARKFAGASTVLMKNNGVLPLSKSDNLTIALIGQTSSNPVTGGGGSGLVVPYYRVSPLQAVSEVLAGDSAPACTTYPGVDFYQAGNPSATAVSADACCAMCAAQSDCVVWTFKASESLCWFKPSMDGKRQDPTVTSGVCSARTSNGRVVSYTGTDPNQAVAVAKTADVAIVFGATSSHEGADRDNLSLQNNDDDIISAVVNAVPNSIVVFVTPGPLLTPWSDAAGAVVNMLMPGQEMGHAMTDVLFGDVNPSGRLSLTFPNKENEMEFTQLQYPGLPANNPVNSNYTEKLEVGYRWYDAHNVTPKFAFGHGLSYTSFAYTDLSVSGRTVSFTVKNTGRMDGAEVAQMYVGFPASSGEPPKQLKGFEKVMLAAGASTSVSFTLRDRDVSIWDVDTQSWAVQTGTFQLYVGASSRDIRLTGTMDEN